MTTDPPVERVDAPAARWWRRWGMFGAALAAAGILLSGPLGLALVAWTHPQPPWRDAATWAQHHHPIQSVPYLFGLLMVAGFVMQLVALHGLAPPRARPRTLTALVATSVFAALIAFNYIVQTTFLPALAAGYHPALAPVIEVTSMSSPSALCWSIEMWGYGFLGVAGWLAATVLDRSRLERAVAWLLMANALVSVAGVVVTMAVPGWFFRPSGLVSYAAWNALVLVASVLLLLALARRDAT